MLIRQICNNFFIKKNAAIVCVLGVVSLLLYMQKQNIKYAESIKLPPMQKVTAHSSTAKLSDIPIPIQDETKVSSNLKESSALLKIK